MPLTKSQIIIITVVGAVIIIFALIFLGILPGKPGKESPQKIKAVLELWGAADQANAYSSVFQNFKTLYPNVTINYRSFDENDYEFALLEALASAKGPDIFLLNNKTLLKNLNKITALPAEKLSLIDLRQLFPQVVENDFIEQGKIYALPASIDTLALFYNRDLLDQAAVSPPETWEDLTAIINQLKKTDEFKNIIKPAIALGTSRNIERAADILSLLFIQTNAISSYASIQEKGISIDNTNGLKSLKFYLQFSDPNSEFYTWNENLSSDLELFSQEKSALMLNYASAILKIKSRNPFLNFSVSPIPQFKNAEKSLAFADYWAYTVSRQSRYKNLAWDFILFLTTKPENSLSYIEPAKKPPALRSLVNRYAQNPPMNIFARQILIARSWPQIPTNSKQLNEILNQAISGVVNNLQTPENALREAADKINKLIPVKSY